MGMSYINQTDTKFNFDDYKSWDILKALGGIDCITEEGYVYDLTDFENWLKMIWQG